MATREISSYEGVYADQVFTKWGDYGVKVLKKVLIEDLSEYRFIVQEVGLTDSEMTLVDNGKALAVYSSKELRESFGKLWTPGPTFILKKGAVYTDEDGNVYLAQSDTKLWSVKDGTYSERIGKDGTTDAWTRTGSGEKIQLTEKKNISGQSYSLYFG